MKKIISTLLFAVMLTLTFSGCGAENGASEETTENSSQTESGGTDETTAGSDESKEEIKINNSILYQGHASLRITTPEGKVIYVDPSYGKEGYDVPADLILITHSHDDHNKPGLIKTQNPDCVKITNLEALINGEYKTFEFDFVTVEPVAAGGNRNHDVNVCVGYVLTFNNGKTVYISGDTSKLEQMEALAERGLDYAFFCCDGVYNMDAEEASECAALVKAAHNIPYHMFEENEKAENFEADGKITLAAGEVLPIE